MNRDKLMEWLKRNRWQLLQIGYITEYSGSISVIGHHGNACVSLNIKKSELNQIELPDVPGVVVGVLKGGSNGHD